MTASACLRPALRGWKQVEAQKSMIVCVWSPTRLEGMETFDGDFGDDFVAGLRPALRGWKRDVGANTFMNGRQVSDPP